ncbi:MAG: hypothetical protein ACREBG_14080 [Pyrinomonadaceae bacterium]
MPKRTVSSLLVVTASLCLTFPVRAGFEPRTPLKFDAFGQVGCAEEVVRLENYAKELNRQPSALAVVAVYGGRRDTREGEVVARLFRIRDHLIHRNSIDPNRIVMVDGGFRERLEMVFWIVPSESRDAVWVLLSSEISSKDVRLKAPVSSKWTYKCVS